VIPLSRSLLGSEEAAAVSDVLNSGRLVLGPHVLAFERAVAEFVGRKHAVAVSSGTSALQLALAAVGVQAGAEVVVPDLTWPSPGHAVLTQGAQPVLIDVDAETWNLSVESVRAGLSDRTRAIIAIDQFGCPAPSRDIAQAFPDIPLIVDAACSLGSHDGEQACAARGDVACLSFHPRKLATTGEGGMCLTDDDALAAQLRELRNHGQAAPGVFARAAGNQRLGEMAAAIGCVQLSRLPDMLTERRRLAARYRSQLTDLTVQRWPTAALGNDQTFGVVLPEHTDRDAVIAALRERGIESGRLSYALHTLPQFSEAVSRAHARCLTFPHAERLAQRGLALPLWVGLSDMEQTHVIASLQSVLS